MSQATLLGPAGLIVHINDLETVCNTVKYVDDTSRPIWGGAVLIYITGNSSLPPQVEIRISDIAIKSEMQVAELHWDLSNTCAKELVRILSVYETVTWKRW